MNRSIRFSSCSYCANATLRSACGSRKAHKRRPIQYDSYRSASWKSLFGNLKLRFGSAPSAPDLKQTAADEEAQKRAEEVARQYRETRDQSRRQSASSATPGPAPASQSGRRSLLAERRAVKLAATSKAPPLP